MSEITGSIPVIDDFNYNNNESPIQAENFIWVAEYEENIKGRRFLPEYEFADGGFGNIQHSYNEIDKEKLSKLGLIGCGYNFYYNVDNGIFNLYGSNLEVRYFDGKVEYQLMHSRNNKYNDIIVYRKKAADIEGATGEQKHIILEYGLGYKKIINFFNTMSIFHIPMIKDEPTFFTFRIVSEVNISGELRIYLDNKLEVTKGCNLSARQSKTLKVNIG